MPAVHSGREHEWSKLGCSYGCRADFINDQAQLQGLGVGGCCTAEYSRHGSREELQRERKQECAAIDGYTECWVKHRKLGYQVNLILVLIPEELIFNSRTNYLQKLSSACFLLNLLPLFHLHTSKSYRPELLKLGGLWPAQLQWSWSAISTELMGHLPSSSLEQFESRARPNWNSSVLNRARRHPAKEVAFWARNVLYR